jgi:endonuclease/exonuclease/phosphatase family metal-dependent hydrolase
VHEVALLDSAVAPVAAPKITPVARMIPPGSITPPPAPGTSVADDVRVMSFNCRVSTLFDMHNTWGLLNPDLLGTQEVLASQFDYLRKKLDDYEAIGVGRDNGKRGGEMCAVFFRKDKFERLDGGHFWLSESPSKPGSKAWGAWFPRMVTWVKLRPRDGSGPTFCWFNTHLDAFSARARANGATLLRQRMASIAGGMPVLVTGDFNADAGSEPYATLCAPKSATSLTDTFRAMHRTNRKDDGGGRGGPRIDWILASTDGFRTIDADIDHTRGGLSYPSDHFPVTAVLRPIGGAAAPTLARIE